MKFVYLVVFSLPFLAPVQGSLRRRRKLQLQLVGFGGEPDDDRFPLQRCQGDCDGDEECDEGLVCFQREAPDIGNSWPEVPGCIGGSQFTAETDFCILGPVESIEGAPTKAPTKSPTETPTGTPSVEPTKVPTEEMESTGPTTATPSIMPSSESYWDLPELDFLGNDGNLQGLPLGICQGDCDTDNDCLDVMICFQRDFNEPVPGCRGQARSSMDYCILPPVEQLPHDQPIVTMSPTSVATTAATEMIVALQTVGDATTSDMPLGLCQGDCDSDLDCLDDLVCFQRTSLEAVPGCAGKGRISYDYCILNPFEVATTTASPTEAETMVMTSAPTEQPLVIESIESPTSSPSLAHSNSVAPSFLLSEAPSVQPLLAIVDKDKDGLLGLCEGKCKSDEDCEGDLICMDRDSDDEVPGCGGMPNKADDYCINP